VVVVPLTSSAIRVGKSKMIVDIGCIEKLTTETNSVKKSYALLKSIRSVSRKRILKPVINGKIKNIKLTAEQMNKIDENIIKYFTKS